MPGQVRAKDTMRIAVIGAGSMANRVHYPSLASFDDVRIAHCITVDLTFREMLPHE